MTDNEKLARFQGWHTGTDLKGDVCWFPFGYLISKPLPDYHNDDAAAMSLLDTLVEKGYLYTLEDGKHGVIFVISKLTWSDIARFAFALSRRDAVVAACLELLERETLSGKEDG